MNILLLGSQGQVGSAWVELSPQIIAWDRTKADFLEPDQLILKLEKLNSEKKLDLIINAAAFTQVDQAETDRKKSLLINAITPGKIAEFCSKENIPLVHYSTDYVYSGEGSAPHLEEEEFAPKNYYGYTKAEGDRLIVTSGANYLIFRTSWVYSHLGKNFLLTMLKLGKERELLKVVNDQIGSPTYAPDLVKYSFQAIQISLDKGKTDKKFPSGIYHLCNSGETSWFGFAQEIFKVAQGLGMNLVIKKVEEISSAEYPTPAHRPVNSKLSLQKIKQEFQISPRSWQEALMDCLQQIKRKAS